MTRVSKTKRTLLLFLALYLLAFYSFLPVLMHGALNLIDSKNEKISEGVKAAFDDNLTKASQNTREIASNSQIISYIKEGKNETLASALSEEMKRRNMEVILAIDNQGVVMHRTTSPLKRGDYVFQTTSWGQILARGESYSSIVNGILSPLILSTGVPIIEDGKVQGAIVAGSLLNNDYAARFKKDHLPKGVEMAIYSSEKGLVGTTFTDSEINETLTSHLSPGSDWITSDKYEKRVVINDQIYAVKHIKWGGIDINPGGVIVLIPLNSKAVAAVLAVLAVLGWILVVFAVARLLGKSNSKVSIICAIAVLALIYSSCEIYYIKSSIPIKKTEYPIYNSTMNIDPEVGVFSPAYSRTIALKVNSGGEAVNAFNVVVNFNPEFVTVQDIITTNSVCGDSFFLERMIDNKKGKVIISCVIPNPGYRGQNAILADLKILPRQPGAFEISYDQATQVLANDGLATNVLRQATGGSYFSIAEDVNSTILLSFTHPNGEKWYNQKNISVSWQGGDVTEYAYSFNDQATSTPSLENLTVNNSVAVEAPYDGIFYFHLASVSKGEVKDIKTIKFKIDSTPPEALNVKASETIISPGQVVRFEFNSDDKSSGLQRSYYVKVNDGVFLPTGPQLNLSFAGTGIHTVTIKAFDNAGNIREESVKITVKNKFSDLMKLNLASIILFK